VRATKARMDAELAAEKAMESVRQAQAIQESMANFAKGQPTQVPSGADTVALELRLRRVEELVRDTRTGLARAQPAPQAVDLGPLEARVRNCELRNREPDLIALQRRCNVLEEEVRNLKTVAPTSSSQGAAQSGRVPTKAEVEARLSTVCNALRGDLLAELAEAQRAWRQGLTTWVQSELGGLTNRPEVVEEVLRIVQEEIRRQQDYLGPDGWHGQATSHPDVREGAWHRESRSPVRRPLREDLRHFHQVSSEDEGREPRPPHRVSRDKAPPRGGPNEVKGRCRAEIASHGTSDTGS
jgi:hypothetical protein